MYPRRGAIKTTAVIMYLMPIMKLSTTEIGQVLKTKVIICLLLEYQNFYYKKKNNLSLINIILIIIHISLFFFSI